MEFHQQGGSEKHLRDITGIVLVQGESLERNYIESWARRLDVLPVWEAILRKIASSPRHR